jgi:chromosome segregation ATPase
LDESLEEGYDNPREEIYDVLDRCVNNLDPEDLGDFLQGVIDQCRSLADEKGLLVENVDETSKTSSDIDKEEKEVVDDKSDAELVAEFQESLLKIKNLENDNLSLQEKLSVSNAKEVQLTEDVAKYKQATINLSDEVKSMKDLKSKVDKLTEELESKDKLLKLQESRVSKLRETNKSLSEELKNKDGDIPALQEKVKDLTESLEKITKQLESSKNLVEKYRVSYKALKESYVESKAKNYGLSKEDVLQKLNESYKIKDIDSVCKELSKHKQKMGKLPFRITEDTKVNFKKSDNEYITGNNSGNPSDDYVSDSLLQLANF